MYTLCIKNKFRCYHFSNIIITSVFVEGEAVGRGLAGLAHGLEYKRLCLLIDTLCFSHLIDFQIVLKIK